MNVPLTLSDLSMWLAAIAVILLITSGFLDLSQEYSSRILIDRTRLRFLAIGCGFAFLVTVILQVI